MGREAERSMDFKTSLEWHCEIEVVLHLPFGIVPAVNLFRMIVLLTGESLYLIHVKDMLIDKAHSFSFFSEEQC